MSDNTARSDCSTATSAQNTILRRYSSRAPTPRLGVDAGDAVEFGLVPVILDTTLTVKAEVLVLAPSARSLTCWVEMECNHFFRSGPVSVMTPAVGAVDDYRLVLGGSLFAQWIAVMPGHAGIGELLGAGTADTIQLYVGANPVGDRLWFSCR